ncbi:MULTISPECIES: hypothetical protein [Microbacterium]|uniref:Dinucleotide-utilizing enzyme n=1 Tax=Microbacterium profundi TaxID=450380 RepID=A0ABV3LI54_9MICO|nr:MULTISPECIES: hypothetical protein [Microbacterium]MCE7482379.1 tetraspanin family protein [Microbacterium profundi]
MKKSLTRSISYWFLLVLSLVSAGVGAWLISDNASIMTAKLLDGTATGVEVYVGQPMIVVGAVLLGAGVIGVLLALALAAAKSFVPAAAPVVVEPIDWAAETAPATDASTDSATDVDASEKTTDDASEEDRIEEDQNGSSGSTATATNISVR